MKYLVPLFSLVLLGACSGAPIEDQSDEEIAEVEKQIEQDAKSLEEAADEAIKLLEEEIDESLADDGISSAPPPPVKIEE